jgi:ATP-binding cassette subfamily B protein
MSEPAGWTRRLPRLIARWAPWPLGGLFGAMDDAATGGLLGRYQIVAVLPRLGLPLTCAVAAGVLVSTLLPLVATLAGGALVGAVPGAVRDGLASPSGHQALLALAVLAGSSAASGAAWPVRTALATALAQRLELHLEERVMRAVARPTGIAHLEDEAVLDRIALAQEVGTAGDRPGRALVALTNLAPKWLQSLLYAVVLAQFSWWLSGAVALAWYGAAYLERRATVRASRVVIERARLLRRSNYVRDLVLTPAAAKEVRLFGLTPWLVERFRAAWLLAMVDVWRARRLTTGPLLLAVLLLTVVLAVAGAILGGAALRGEIDLGALTVYLAAALGMGTFFGLVPDDRALLYGAAAVPAVIELEGLTSDGPPPPAARDSATPAGLARPATPAEGLPRHLIRFQGVRFRYPRGGAAVFDGLDLDIPAGRSLAVVGANGAGKTTLVKLLCRLYEPAEGCITVDGVDLRQFEARSWQRQIAAIFQDFVRYHLPLRDNIAFGAPAAAHDFQRLAEAADRAGVSELVSALPHGWETVLSREFSGGADLSGGQWQRVALGRALFAVAAGARVLMLDEPTAHLDVRAEAALYDRFLELTRGLTTVLISHRFSTVRRADRICVLEQGRVVEQGTHHELLAAAGRYAHMFTLQAQRFAASAPLATPGAGEEGP